MLAAVKYLGRMYLRAVLQHTLKKLWLKSPRASCRLDNLSFSLPFLQSTVEGVGRGEEGTATNYVLSYGQISNYALIYKAFASNIRGQTKP